MKVDYLLWPFVLVGVGLAGYTYGHRKGLEDAPETVAYNSERDAAWNAQMAEIEVLYPSTREAVCERIYDMVLYNLNETPPVLDDDR